jgi:alpha-L-fucosidase
MRLPLISALFVCAASLAGLGAAAAAQPAAAASTASTDKYAAERNRRFNDYKFGMFIHWGPYSQASVEASWPIMRPRPGGISEADYVALAKTFNPVEFDPKSWVQLAKDAGQRYMVFTSKHHDGFCMFDSAYTDYKITNTPYKKDIAAMLAQAAHEGGLPFGFYYSPPDMHHTGYRDTSKLAADGGWQGEPARPEWPIYIDYMEMQVRELLTRYGDIFVIWFDGLSNQRKYDGLRIHKMIHDIQPMALINNRIGLTGDFVTPEQRLPKGIPRKSSLVGNTDPNDKGVTTDLPTADDFQPWETCMTINGTWAYNKNDLRYKSTTQLIRALVDAASKGGNFLLNVGPTPQGTIQPEFAERLRGIGAWLKVNGDAIYGTTFGPVQNLTYGRMTAKGKTVYVHVFDWPSGGTLEVPGLKAKVTKAIALNGNKPLKFRQQANSVSLELAGLTPDANATVLALETK